MRSLVVFACLSAGVGCTKSDPAPAPNVTDVAEASAPAAEATAATRQQEQSADEPGPVLVELFTSQGCSSCPPADAILSQIGKGEFGDDVIALAFHVDYWNYIGWRDPFSSKKWSELQRRYGRTISKGRVYTPMLVVDGESHVVGSHARKAKREIVSARKRINKVALTVARAASSKSIVADVTWNRDVDAEIWVAVTESGLSTSVGRGENSGRELANDHIVRALVRGEPRDGERSARVEIPAGASWNSENLRLVAFARDPGSLAILGAARE